MIDLNAAASGVIFTCLPNSPCRFESGKGKGRGGQGRGRRGNTRPSALDDTHLDCLPPEILSLLRADLLACSAACRIFAGSAFIVLEEMMMSQVDAVCCNDVVC